MGFSVVVISIAAPTAVEGVVRQVRQQYAEAHVTAVVGSMQRVEEVDEALMWRDYGGVGLVKEIRRRRPDVLVVVYGRDQYLSRAYWKMAALVALSGARRLAFCGDGWGLGAVRGGGPAVVRAVGQALRGAAGQAAAEVYVGAIGLLLLPVLIGIVITDATERVAGTERATGRTAGARR